jgi:hypothetical protein
MLTVMKKFLLAFAILMGVTTSCTTVEGQISIGVNINIGRQPAWGPVGYNYVDYYYLPDLNCYFNVNLGLFYYFDMGMWYSSSYLPYAYRGCNLYNMYKVVLVGVNDPWRYNYRDMRNYARFRGVGNQMIIRDSRDIRYRDSRNNKVAWYSGNRNMDNSNRNSAYQSNNRSYSGNYNNGNRNNNWNFSNNNRSNNVINNNGRAENRGQQNFNMNRQQSQRSINNQSASGRNNNERSIMRSSSSRSESYAGSYEKRQGNHRSESSGHGRRGGRGR